MLFSFKAADPNYAEVVKGFEMSDSLSKKAVLVTGGSRGIGRAVSIRLAHEGYHVVVNYRSDEQEAGRTLENIREAGGTAELSRFDISDRSETRGAVEVLLEKYSFYGLVLSAGVRHDEAMVFMNDEQWDSVVDTNLTGFYNVTKPFVRHMLLNRMGRIVVISSTSGQSGLRGQVNYAASKAGLIGAAKSLALECAKRGVLVNALTPGFIETDMIEDVDRTRLAAGVPLRRFGKPKEVAGVVSFLMSEDAGYITGQVIGINGGIYM